MKKLAKPEAVISTEQKTVHDIMPNNTLVVTEEGQKMILQALKNATMISKGVSTDIIRYAALFFNIVTSDTTEAKKEYSIASLSDKAKNTLKHRCYDYFLNYDNPSFHKLHYCKDLKYTGATYNLKELVEVYEEYLEQRLFQVGAIDENNNIVDKTMYEAWYNKCRLYLNEDVFVRDFKFGSINVIDVSANKKNDPLIDYYKNLNHVKVDWLKHVRLTTSKIQEIYQNALNIMITDDMFCYNV